MAENLEKVAELPNGTYIYRVSNGVGGHRYWSDAIGGGAMIWDTALASIEELEAAIEYEKEKNGCHT